MKITMYPTSTKADVCGAPCRIWIGSTNRQIPVYIAVAAVAVGNTEDTEAFDAELEVFVGRPEALEATIEGERLKLSPKEVPH